MYKFVLKYDNQSLNIATDPIGWDEGSYTLRRSQKDGDGTFKNFNIDLTWVKAGAEFVRNAYQEQGIEAQIDVFIYVWEPNAAEWNLTLKGKLNLTEYEVSTDRGRLEVTAPIENSQFETRFLSLRKKDVDLQLNTSYNGAALPALPTTSADLHATTIAEEYEGENSTDISTTTASTINIGASEPGDVSRNVQTTWYLALSMNKTTKDSLETNFTLGFGFTSNFDAVANFFQFDFDTLADIVWDLPLQLDLRFVSDHKKGRVNCGDNEDLLQQLNFQMYFEWRDRNDVLIEKILVGQNTDVSLCHLNGGEHTSTLTGAAVQFSKLQTQYHAGDKIYAYVKCQHIGDYHRLFLNSYNVTHNFTLKSFINSSINISGLTTYQETAVQGVMVYECLQRLAEHYTGKSGAFYSDYYGRTDLGYAADGDGSQRIVCSGLNLRGHALSESPMFLNWDDFYKSLEAIDCVGFGFEEDANGETRLRVEPKEYFYEDAISVVLDGVKKLNKRASKELYTTTFEVGYAKWTGQKDVGTLVEYNSERQYYTGLTQIETEMEIVSKIVAGSFAIESTRRLQKDTTDKDGQYDEDIFAIQVIPGTVAPWQSEADQYVETISGVVEPAGIYNIRLTPARMIRKWARVIASNFVNLSNNYVSGLLRFSSGKGNYNVVSKLTGYHEVAEGTDIDMIGQRPIWINEVYSFEYPLTFAQFELIRASPKQAIAFIDNGGVQRTGYIEEVEVDLRTPGKSLSKFKLLRRYE